MASVYLTTVFSLNYLFIAKGVLATNNNSQQGKLFVLKNFDSSDIRSTTDSNIDPGKSLIHCAAACGSQGPEVCQGFQRDPTDASGTCTLVTFYPWASPGNGGDVLVHAALDYLGNSVAPVPQTCQSSNAQVVPWNQLPEPTCSLDPQHCQALLLGEPVALGKDQEFRVTFQEYVVFDAIEAVWHDGDGYLAPTRVKIRFDQLDDDDLCKISEDINVPAPTGDQVAVGVDGSSADKGTFGGYCLSIEVNEPGGGDEGISLLRYFNIIRGCTDVLGVASPPCPNPTTMDWSALPIDECGRDFDNTVVVPSPEICQDIFNKNPIQLIQEEWVVVKLTTPITFGAMDAHWEIEGVGPGFPFKVKLRAVDANGNDQDQLAKMNEGWQTVPVTRGIYDGMNPAVEIRLKPDKIFDNQVAILKEWRLIQSCN